jgi:hypothetical protein
MRSMGGGGRPALGLYLAGTFVLSLVNGASAGCLVAPAKLSDGAMQAFRNQPAELLKRHPAGGPAMSAEVARRVGSDASVLALVIQLAKEGTPAQRVAIGIGVAKVISTCGRLQPDLESTIRQAVAQAALPELSAAFAAGLGSLEALAETAPTGGPESAGGLTGSTGRPPESGNPPSQPGAGGVASTTTGTELLTINVFGPPASLTARSLNFSGREVTSTSGSTVSPTRP